MSNPPVPPVVPTPEQIEYERMKKYFEWLVRYSFGAIGIVIAVAVGFLWHNMTEYREDAKNAATREAQRAISEALATPKLQASIDAAVQSKVGPLVDAEIEKTLGKRINEVEAELTEMVDIARKAAYVSVIVDNNEALHYLIGKLDSPLPEVRKLVRHVLEQAYAEAEKEYIKTEYAFDNRSTKYCMFIVRNPDSYLKDLTMAFHDMKKLTGWNVEPLDVKAAEQWCDKHKPKCDQ